LALLVPSVVSIWYTVGTTVIPGLLVPVLAAYFERLKIPAGYAFAAMLLGWITSAGSLVYGWRDADAVPAYWWGLEPMIPGLAVSVLVWTAGRVAMNLRGARTVQ
jgi:hypothetical protein